MQNRQSGSGRDTSLPQTEEHTPPASHQHVTQPKPRTPDQVSGTQQAAPTVTNKQMQDSGYGAAFARIVEGIPDHIKQHVSTDSGPSTPSDDSRSQPESVVADDVRSEVGAAVAAAMDKAAEQQQQPQAASLVGGAAYPDHVAQVCH